MKPEFPPPPDAAQRKRALDPSRSFIVRAPAGSGKTELLIQRYLALLATVEAPEEIIAITFTRKAAAEMRERVLRKLAQENNPLALNPARLRIQTIDSLCASLARQMPVLSRFGALPEIVEEARELHEAAALATIGLVDESGRAEVARHVERLLDHLDNDVGRIQGLLADMLARRDHWIRHLAQMDRADLEAALEAERARALDEARALYPGADPGAHPSDLQAWQSLAESLLTQAGTWRKRSAEALVYAAEGNTREPLRAALRTLLVLPPACYSDEQWEVLESIGALLPFAIAQLKVVFQSRGQVDFTEVAQGALRALGDEGEPTDLALALDYRIRHLLIDEFQDTSISQFQLVARLTEGWEPGDGRTVFAVGDPMQSIYRFREAEVGLFLRACEEGLGTVELEQIELNANFRSQAGIVHWVNETFSRVMPRAGQPAEGAVSYCGSVPVHPRRDGNAVSVHPFFDKDRQGEAEKVVEIVREVQAGEPEASVAILVRTRSHLAEIVPLLKAAGLAFRAIKIEGLTNRPVVQDLLSLTRALSHPGDRLAWLAVLRAPWCGLTLEDLGRLAEGNESTVFEAISDPALVSTLSADAQARLARVTPVLTRCLQQRLRGTLRDAVEGAWMDLGGPACVEGETDLEDAGIYLDHLESHEEAGSIGQAFEDGLAKLYALPDLQADERLQIMTIHNAKGLEFDHVILPGLSRAPKNDDKRLFLWMETVNGLMLAPIQETGADTDPIYSWLQKLDTAKASHEAARLVYVAATRARARLHLLCDARIKDGFPCKPGASTLLAKLWHVASSHFDAVMSTRRAGQGQPALASLPDQSLIRLQAAWRPPARPAPAAWMAPLEDARLQEDLEFSWAGETARHLGSVVHRWLQRIAEDGLGGWDAPRIEKLAGRFAIELAARGVALRELEAASQKVVAALTLALQDDRGRWLLGPREQAANEMRLRAVSGGRLRTLVIDRMFFENGTRWIVDYKTSSHQGAGIEGFLENERNRYAPQLGRYADALGPARLGLYFPMLRGWREWEHEPG
jgi:ATP-dependent helicase/nuclease subunit A